MTAHVKVGGVWRTLDPRMKVGGVWKDATGGWVKVAGVWRQFYAPYVPPSVTLITQSFVSTGGNTAIIFTPETDDLVVIVSMVSANTGASATLTDNQGGTYSMIQSAVFNGSAWNIQLWVRDTKPSAAVSHTALYTPSGTTTGGGLGVLVVKGTTKVGSAAIRQSNKAENFGGSAPSVTLAAAPLTTNPLIGFAGFTSGAGGFLPKTGWTEHFDVGYTTPTASVNCMSIDSGETATAIAWTGGAGGSKGAIVAEFDTSP